MNLKGIIFDIQKFSIHDGPGIRTSVFFKGCPLRCLWCHNPEGIAPHPQLSFFPDLCVGCGACIQHCPRHAHRMADGRHIMDHQLCVACGTCAKTCPAEALAVVGRKVTVENVMTEVLADRSFYETSGGGLTLSGGEPLAQLDFAEALLKAAKREGLHCCLETCGFGSYAALERIRGLVDLFLYDIKEMDPRKHRDFTGVPLQSILDNLISLHNTGAAIRLRLPIIPGYNDRLDHFKAMGSLCATLPRLQGVEVLPFHPFGQGKRKRFGVDPSAGFRAPVPEQATVDSWLKELRDGGVKVLNETPAGTDA